MQDKVMTWIQQAFIVVCERKLRTDYDPDLRASDIVFFIVNHCLVMMIICPKLFINPTMHDKIMAPTLTCFTEAYEQSLSATLTSDPSNMVLIHNTSSCFDDHLCQIIFKSHHEWQSYGSDTNSFTEAYT